MSDASSPRLQRVSEAARPAFLALSAVGAFASHAAWASDADDRTPRVNDADQRDDVLVQGKRDGKPVDPKLPAPLLDTPRSIVVLPKEVIEQTGSATLQDALRTVPGITFGAAEGGNPVGDRPFIRGFDSQGSIFVDGVRDTGSQTREVFAIEQVQVVRGSDSTLAGRGAAGGAINILSKQPMAENFVRSTFSYGNADYKRGTLDANWFAGHTVGVRLAAMFHDQDVAGRDALWQRRWGVAPSVTVGLGTDTRLTVDYYHLTSHEMPDSGLPYRFTAANQPAGALVYSEPALGTITTRGGRTGVVDRSAFYGLANRDFRDQDVDQATMRFEHDFGTLTLRNTARWAHTYQQYIFTNPDDSQGNVIGTAAANPTTGAAGARGDILTGGYVWRRGNTRYGYVDTLADQVDLYGTATTGSIKHAIAAGAEVSWQKTRRGAFVSANGSTLSPRCNAASIARFYCADLFDPNPYDPWVNYTSDTSAVRTPIVKGPLNSETRNDAQTQAVYASDSITIVPELIVNLGVRYDRFRSTVTPSFAAGASSFEITRTDKLFNWQAGIVFKPTANTSLYASYATSATPPNSLLGEGQEGNGLGTTNTPAALALLDTLKPEKTKSYEIGAKADLLGERLSIGLAGFQTDTKNARVTGSNNTVEFIGERRIRGVELSVNGTILPGWTVFGGYTHLDPKIVDGGFSSLTVAAVSVGGVVVQPARTIIAPSINNGRQAPQTARESFTAWTNVEPMRGFQIGGGAFYTSRVFGGYGGAAVQDAAGNVSLYPAVLARTVPGYWRFDARASYRFTPQIELSVNAQNLADKAYFNQAFTTHYASIAPGRTVFGTLSFRY